MTTAEFEQFLRRYYRERILELARSYPEEARSLTIHWDDLYQFDPDLADELRAHPKRVIADATLALREFDLPVDVDLDEAAVLVEGYPRLTQIRDLRAEHVNRLIAVRGIVRKATPVRPKVEVAIYECLTCAGEIEVVQRGHELREPNRCPHCERNTQLDRLDERSRFVDSQRLRVQESPEGLRGGETPENIDIHLEDDLTGVVSPGDRVTATGILRLREQTSGGVTSPVLDVFLEGVHVEAEEEEFEVMEINDEDIELIEELATSGDIYERVVESIAPSIWGYDDEKFAMALQLFSGVRKSLPDGSRVRGDIHVLLVGDPGTGKCVAPGTLVTMADGEQRPIDELVEEHLVEPTPVDDGVWDYADIPLRTMTPAGELDTRNALRVWMREAPDHMVRITTEHGHVLEMTPSHPLFARGEIDQPVAVRAEHLGVGMEVAIDPGGAISKGEPAALRADGGQVTSDVAWTTVTKLEAVKPAYTWVYDLEVPGTHTYVSEGVVSHNSQLLQYITKIAPRSVYTSGKGSSAAGLTAAAIRDDFGDGSQWSLEAGALVLADQGIAAVDELDKMRCVTGDTLVRLADGSSQSIGSLAEKAASMGAIEQLTNGRTIRGIDAEVWTMTDDRRLTTRPVRAIHEYDPPETLIQVEVTSGETLQSTPDHPHLVVAEGTVEQREAEAVEVGDKVLVPTDGHRLQPDGGTLAEDGSGRSPDVTVATVTSVSTITNNNEHVYDLTVAGTHNYVANGIIVHNSEDRSAMHEALEQQSVSVSKAGINATLQARCALLGAANPKYGRFDQYEPIPEQIELEPALISRFDLIFTVDDLPDPDRDERIADHILTTNYAGELNSRREIEVSDGALLAEVEEVSEVVTPAIEPELLRKYVAYATQTCVPMMTDEARQAIKDFYLNLRGQGVDEDSPVPMTARKLEALVRLAEASARIRLSGEVTREDAERVIRLVEASMGDIGLDPETGAFDVDMIETGTPKTQRDRIRSLRHLLEHLEGEYDKGVPIDRLLEEGEERGMDADRIEHELSKMKQSGEIYEPSSNRYRLA